MEELAIFLCLVLFFGSIGIMFYKYRAEIKRFIKDPEVGSSYEVPRKTVLKRKIEDATDEIQWLERKEAKENTGTEV